MPLYLYAIWVLSLLKKSFISKINKKHEHYMHSYEKLEKSYSMILPNQLNILCLLIRHALYIKLKIVRFYLRHINHTLSCLWYQERYFCKHDKIWVIYPNTRYYKGIFHKFTVTFSHDAHEYPPNGIFDNRASCAYTFLISLLHLLNSPLSSNLLSNPSQWCFLINSDYLF